MRNFVGRLFGKPKSSAHAETKPRLAAFGKHPGWDDHIDDLGVTTPLLLQFKELLYLQGLSSQIDQGAWELLGEGGIEGFDHTAVWDWRTHFIVGRLWSSQDGKGRSKYPMVLVAHGGAEISPALLSFIDTALELISAQCRMARHPDQVREIVDAGGRRLDVGYAEHEPELVVWIPPTDLELARVLYEIDTRLEAFTSANGNPKSRLSVGAKGSLRVPVARNDWRHLYFWIHVLRSRIHPEVPVLFLHARTHGWVDVLVGQPGPDDFFCLRAGLAVIPLTTAIPYDISPELTRQAEELIEEFAAPKSSANSR